ncbi:hypothetical protein CHINAEXTREME_19150 [Halobiforma lacisalsi AJ5]|uniref:Halobacterial output domain-containing protein n=1 Tax=Natronobacterium lacisalsi AJ5 TaxID=358396 RepID=M0LSF7_NATLA|nr:HalOD1 output domain-containing protein [Halobiforma lacisalsi]APW99755.1 hypothetical protein CHINAEXTREME_19150 [Halobiforma lacisalsi AJ5]EMA36068.1 hypothetical protein C445_04403 [Halobiforma lacisalsi AJ5]
MNATNPAVRELGTDSSPDAIEYEYDAETPASIAVVHAICAVADVDPLEAPTALGFVLHEHVDPGAIDTLLGDGTGDGNVVVSFDVSDDQGQVYAVEISDDGRIGVRALDSAG